MAEIYKHSGQYEPDCESKPTQDPEALVLLVALTDHQLFPRHKPSIMRMRAMRFVARNVALSTFSEIRGSEESPSPLIYMAPRAGFEPATQRLTAACSTTELLRIRASHPLPRNLARERELGGAPPDGRAYSKQFHKLQTSLTTNL